MDVGRRMPAPRSKQKGEANASHVSGGWHGDHLVHDRGAFVCTVGGERAGHHATSRAVLLAAVHSVGGTLLPTNYRDWIFVGSPLTPNALNDGHADFPEYHNVYIQPCAYEPTRRRECFP